MKSGQTNEEGDVARQFFNTAHELTLCKEALIDGNHVQAYGYTKNVILYADNPLIKQEAIAYRASAHYREILNRERQDSAKYQTEQLLYHISKLSIDTQRRLCKAINKMLDVKISPANIKDRLAIVTDRIETRYFKEDYSFNSFLAALKQRPSAKMALEKYTTPPLKPKDPPLRTTPEIYETLHKTLAQLPAGTKWGYYAVADFNEFREHYIRSHPKSYDLQYNSQQIQNLGFFLISDEMNTDLQRQANTALEETMPRHQHVQSTQGKMTVFEALEMYQWGDFNQSFSKMLSHLAKLNPNHPLLSHREEIARNEDSPLVKIQRRMEELNIGKLATRYPLEEVLDHLPTDLTKPYRPSDMLVTPPASHSSGSNLLGMSEAASTVIPVALATLAIGVAVLAVVNRNPLIKWMKNVLNPKPVPAPQPVAAPNITQTAQDKKRQPHRQTRRHKQKAAKPQAVAPVRTQMEESEPVSITPAIVLPTPAEHYTVYAQQEEAKKNYYSAGCAYMSLAGTYQSENKHLIPTAHASAMEMFLLHKTSLFAQEGMTADLREPLLKEVDALIFSIPQPQEGIVRTPSPSAQAITHEQAHDPVTEAAVEKDPGIETPHMAPASPVAQPPSPVSPAQEQSHPIVTEVADHKEPETDTSNSAPASPVAQPTSPVSSALSSSQDEKSEIIVAMPIRASSAPAIVTEHEITAPQLSQLEDVLFNPRFAPTETRWVPKDPDHKNEDPTTNINPANLPKNVDFPAMFEHLRIKPNPSGLPILSVLLGSASGSDDVEPSPVSGSPTAPVIPVPAITYRRPPMVRTRSQGAMVPVREQVSEDEKFQQAAKLLQLAKPDYDRAHRLYNEIYNNAKTERNYPWMIKAAFGKAYAYVHEGVALNREDPAAKMDKGLTYYQLARANLSLWPNALSHEDAVTISRELLLISISDSIDLLKCNNSDKAVNFEGQKNLIETMTPESIHEHQYRMASETYQQYRMAQQILKAQQQYLAMHPSLQSQQQRLLRQHPSLHICLQR